MATASEIFGHFWDIIGAGSAHQTDGRAVDDERGGGSPGPEDMPTTGGSQGEYVDYGIEPEGIDRRGGGLEWVTEQSDAAFNDSDIDEGIWSAIDEDKSEGAYLDILGEEAMERATAATRAVITEARDARPPAGSFDVSALDETIEVFGADVDESEDMPILSTLIDHFRGAPMPVRVDTKSSYADFREEGSEEMADFRERLDDLEDAVREHLEDEKIHLSGILGNISNLRDSGVEKVPLRMPPGTEDAVECWREGDMICASIRLPGSDGQVRICTSAVPIQKSVIEASEAALRAQVDPVDVLGTLPTVACMLGGGKVVRDLVACSSQLLARPEVEAGEVFIGRADRSKDEVRCASLLALLQECQRGNKAACDEWKALADKAERDKTLMGAMKTARRALEASQKRRK